MIKKRALKKGERIYENNRLVVRVTDDKHRIFSQGKRVADSCPINRNERRAYVIGGSVPCIIEIRKRIGGSFRAAYDLLQRAK